MTKGGATREHILHRAATVFNRLGYAAASLSDLEAATGLKTGGIYRHFPGGKEALAVEALRWAVARVDERFHDAAAIDGGAPLDQVIGLLKDRASTVKEIADNAAMFYREPVIDADAFAQHVTDAVRPAIADLRAALKAADWTKEAVSAALKATLAAHKLKMPQLAMPVRLLVAGTTHTPSIDAVLMLFGRDVVLARLEKAAG